MKRELGGPGPDSCAIVISAACASSGASSKPEPPQMDSGENWAKAAPSELPSRPAKASAVATAGLASW
jgi:hypothetical protein